jgi:hypothetical protein
MPRDLVFPTVRDFEMMPHFGAGDQLPLANE